MLAGRQATIFVVTVQRVCLEQRSYKCGIQENKNMYNRIYMRLFIP